MVESETMAGRYAEEQAKRPSEPEHPREVHVAMSFMEEALSALDGMAQRLGARLQPLVAPSPSADAVQLRDQKPRFESQHANTIEAQTERVLAITDLLRHLNASVQV